MIRSSIRRYNWKDRKVLIVEDDPSSIFLLTEILQHTGITILTADEGRKALNVFKRNGDTDIVLLDLLIPQISGLEIVRRIKEIRPVPIIVQSAHTLIEERDKALAAGCDAYLSKPINTFELLGTMHRFLHKTDELPYP